MGATEVQQIDHAIALFGDWQDLYGGGACEDAIAGEVRWAAALLNASATDKVRNDLYRSVGFLADVAGWGSFSSAAMVATISRWVNSRERFRPRCRARVNNGMTALASTLPNKRLSTTTPG